MTATLGPGRDDLDKLERKHAENPEGRYFVPLANAYRRAGAVDRAIGVLRAGLESHPDYLSAHVVLGRCLLDAGRDQEAAAEFRYVLSLDPQNLVALRTLGDLALAAGDTEEGAVRYRELLEVDPLNPEARAALDAMATGPDAPDDPAPEPEHEDEPFDDADYASGEIAPAAPESEDEDHDALFGTMINLGEEPDSPEPGDGNAVVTETIAELYTRQGFYHRAAGVYRELIRRRGAEDRLVRALERVETLASGGEDTPIEGGREGEEAVTAGGAAEGGMAQEAPEEASAEAEVLDPLGVLEGEGGGDPSGVEPEMATEAGEVEPARSDAAPPDAAEAAVEHDPFADSFVDGFPTLKGAGDSEPAEVPTAAPLQRASREGEASPAPSGTIRDLFATVVGWSVQTEVDAPRDAPTSDAPQDVSAEPGESVEPGESSSEAAWRDPSDDDAGEEAGEAEDSAAEEKADPADAATLGSTAAAADDDLLFPWELTDEEQEASIAEASADEGGPAGSEAAHPSGDEVAVRPEGIAAAPTDDDEAGDSGSEVAAQPGPVEEASAAEEEDDDDLESFQEWLRSLRR